MGLPKMLFSTPTFNCPECGNKMKKTKDFSITFALVVRKECRS